MYNFKKIVNSVKSFKKIGLIEIIGLMNRNLIVDNYKVSSDVDTSANSLKIYKNLLFFDRKNNHAFYDIINQKLYETEHYKTFPFSKHDNLFVCIYNVKVTINGDLIWKTGLYNFEENTLVKEYLFLKNTSILYSLNLNSVITIYNKTGISKISLEDGKCIWFKDFDADYINIVELSKNLPLVLYSKSNISYFVFLDIENGNEVWSNQLSNYNIFDVVINTKKNLLSNLHCGSFYLNGVQIAQSANVFTEINLSDGSFSRHEVLKDLDKAGLGVSKFIVEGDYIYFTATYQGSFGAVAIGVLDYESLALLWWQPVEMQAADGFGNFLMNKPVVGGDKLYILDKTNVLHIFERIED